MLEAYRDFLKARERRGTEGDPDVTSEEDDRDETATTMETETTTIACVRKPSCTPDGTLYISLHPLGVGRGLGGWG